MPERRDQEDVLPKKDRVTKSDKGLQQWGEQDLGAPGQHGSGSEGTAERAARLSEGQRGQRRPQPAGDPIESFEPSNVRPPSEPTPRRAPRQFVDDEEEG